MRLTETLAALTIGSILTTAGVDAQDRLKAMPGYERFNTIGRQIQGSVKPGTIAATWIDGGKAFEYRKDGKAFRYDVAAAKATELGAAAADPSAGRRGRRGGGPERGRQLDSATSPDGKLKAFHRDRNLWLGDAGGAIEVAITTDGDVKTRIKNGVASWVYGEELDQATAIWWSPDSTKVAFYRFDEGQVKDYFLSMKQGEVQDALDVEPYPKAGAPNPVAEILVYDLKSRKTTRLDVRDGRPFDDSVVGHYAYNVAWSADSKSVLFDRTNRRQNIMEFVAGDPETGKVRVVVREEWPASWVENSPKRRFLADGKRFVWASERTGWNNLYLYNLSGDLLATLTRHEFEVGDVVRIDEKASTVDYLARSGDNPMKLQLHRVGLDGKGDRRLTDPALHHTVDVAPDGQHFLDRAEAHDKAPTTRLVDAEGKVVAELARSDLSAYEKLGLKPVESLEFKAADGTTPLRGLLHRPSNFDPKKAYPLLVSVYAGPATNGARETFTLPSPLTEYGFLVASFDSRSAAGRGKKALDAIYLKLGQVEMDDQAAGVRSLWDRPYLDKTRVGIYGTSYGGTASIACLLRHPDAFRAACASSPVTDWRNYDSIYTERYMWLPTENKAGYDAGSTVAQAAKLKGRLMLFYGTADNNVHPSNAMQLIAALQAAGKSFEVQVGPDQGHASIRQDRMMEFFLENLVLPRPDLKDDSVL